MEKTYSINHQIKANQVRLISSDGEMRGVFSLSDALAEAEVEEFDLVEMSIGKDKLSVCKIMDYGKMMYEKKKEEKKRKSKQVAHSKEIKYSFNITDYDLAIKHKKVNEFLRKHYIVRYALELRGRETHLVDEAIKKINGHLKEFEDKASWQTPSVSGRGSRVNISTVLRSL